MKKKYLLAICCSIFCSVLGGVAQGALISTNEVGGSLEEVASITTYSTLGTDMDGMEITVQYSDGSFDTTSFWDGAGSGTGAQGNGWSLTMSDPTKTTYWSSYWIFDVEAGGKSVASIILDGFDNNVVFDNEDIVPAGGQKGTLGSEWGNLLTIDYYNAPTTTYAGFINVDYIGDVKVVNQALYGDVYQSMLISFANAGFTENDSFAFYQDTDNITNPVPEPATVLLFGLGVMGLVGSCLVRKEK